MSTLHKKLNELQATAICGNDISSSCLYVSAFTIGIAGFYAPLIFGLVVIVLLLVDLDVLDRSYPEIKIHFETIKGEKFTSELIDRLSKEWDIPKNFMFISSPSEKIPFSIPELGGMRLIL